MNNKILIAEDEANIRRLVAHYLLQEGFEIVEAANGRQALELFENTPDLALAILDVMMPEMDGYEVCRRIRAKSDLPVLILTARDTESDEVAGFRCGADEYISKPFSPAILVTRVKNLLRRTQQGDHSDLEADGIRVLYRERTVLADGKRVIMTPKEFDLLCYLMRNKNIVLSREQIINRIWDMDYSGDDRTVDTHIKCLRAKLGAQGKHIVTIRKVGYKFEQYL